MYTRQINGREIELRVSGQLYQDALVMYDRQTGTLWTQVDGRALRGPLVGNRLVEVPAMHTTWKVWKKLHPDTLVLRKPKLRGSVYRDYRADRASHGVFGTSADPRLGGKTIIVGIHEGGEAVPIPLAALKKERLKEIRLAGEPLVVFYSRTGRTVTVFRRVVDGRSLAFRLRKNARQEFLEDKETGSQWSPLEGLALGGPLEGRRLDPVPYVRGYWYAWSVYYPETHLLR